MPNLRQRPARSLQRSENRAGYLFIFPALVFLLAFVAFPIIYNIVISLREVNVYTFTGEQSFVGLRNYRDVLAMPVLGKAVRNTLYFTVMCILFQFVIGFGLAMMFSKPFPLSRLARGMLMVCWLVPTIVTASVWQWIYAGDSSGILNFLLMKLHVISSPISWMTSATGAMWALIITNVWKGVPFNMLLLSTALTTLPQDVLEAASIDGAGRWKRFVHITLPMLRPSIVSVVTLGFIYTFKTFELIYIMTQGGPLNATENLATVSYRLTFSNFEIGQGAAVANLMMTLLIVIGIISQRFMEKDEVMS